MSSFEEEQLRKNLKLDSWRNLSKDKLLTFVAEMPKLDREVALRVIEQFPDFKNLVSSALDSLDDQREKLLKAHWKSQRAFHRASRQYRRALDRELEREGLSVEDRFAILEMLRQAVEREAVKDSENKAFALRIATVGASAAVLVVAGAVAFVGGKVGIGQQGDS